MNISLAKQRLQGFNLQLVSERTGLHVNTLSRIRTGKAKSVNTNTLEKLQKFFDAYMAGMGAA